MNYVYKSFVFICFSLSVVTKEIAAKVAPNNSIELFDNILYQKLNNADDELKDIYSAWAIIKKLVETNSIFLYKPYQEVLNDVLYTDADYKLTESFSADLLKDLSILISRNAGNFKSFYDLGTDKYLKDLQQNRCI